MIIDMNRRGFTIVELMIVIVIMGALLILGVANLRGSQISARDSERKTDIENIAMHLETYYESGSDYTASTGQYPSTLVTLVSSGTAYVRTALRDIDPVSITAPEVDDSTTTFIAATDSTVLTSASAHPTIGEYDYQPIKSDGTLCTLLTDECRKFNLYYRLESDNIVYMVTSKHQ